MEAIAKSPKVRKKRDTSDSPDDNVYMELMIVVDDTMINYYGKELRNYVLTLVFMVNFLFMNKFFFLLILSSKTSEMYKHTSLSIPVNIVLSEIVYANDPVMRKFFFNFFLNQKK